jgi:parallel beta-helix repeat protein
VFEIVKCNSIPTTISNTLTLTKQFSPYLVSDNINVTKTGKLIIEQGSSVYFKRYSGIMVRGIISILGSAENPVIFRSNIKKLESFTQIYLYGNSHNIKHLKMIKGKIYAEYCEMLYIEDVEIQCGIATWYPDYKDYNPSIFMKFTNSKIKNTHLYVSKDVPLDLSVVEGIVAIGGTHKISTCTFRKIPDAVELTISKNSIISYCQILNSPDDGIDINACENILIINNKITNSRDKGISVGGDQSFDVENIIGPSKNIILKNNIFSKNYIGVSVKDSSSVEIDSCFFYDNSISVEAVEKFENVGGGFINIKHCIIEGKIKEDRFSKIILID